MKKYVLDTSAVIDGVVSQMINKGEITEGIILIHRAVLAELEYQANYGREVGFLGLDELKKLRKITEENNKIKLEYIGERPREFEIKYAKSGEIDAMIRETALKEGAVFITLDKVDAEAAKAYGIKEVILIEHPEIEKKVLKIENFFDEKTLSIHLKEGVPPYAKKGYPGKWEFVKINEQILTKEEIQEIAKEIIEEAKSTPKYFIESEKKYSTIIQLGDYRIIILKTPLSDGWEITAVRPIKKMSLEEYNLNPKLIKRFEERAEGIIISGPPGMGKSTFAQALGEFYYKKGKIIKTIESPRDLKLPDEITQISNSIATNHDEIRDILLLTRPDYSIYDEMRNNSDFYTFSDLRLAGVGMIGVIHASSPIDAIQRFIGRVELGMLPSIIDTVLFIENGKVAKVYELKMSVKVPRGMTEKDLARPVIEVKDFFTEKEEYEMYSFGDHTIVIPIQNQEKNYIDIIKKEIRLENINIKVNHGRIEIHVPKKEIKKIIGKGGKRIKKLEKRIGMPIDIIEA